MTTNKPKPMKPNAADDFQTPKEALDCLAPYLDKAWTIWEPACGKGNLVDGLFERGFNVVGTDIKGGHDFLNPDQSILQSCGAIVTNPPFSIKNKFLEQCYATGKPFALLLPYSVFDSQERRALMAKNGVQMIVTPRRYTFETPNHEKNVAEGKKTGGAWFATCWICNKLALPAQIVFPG